MANKSKKKKTEIIQGGSESNAKVRIAKSIEGSILQIPIASGGGRVRLPDNLSDYTAPSRPAGRADTPQEAKIKDMAAKGNSVEKIVVATGCHQIAVCKLLGLPLEGRDFETTKINLENRKRL